MTKEEFDNTGWGADMWCIYKGASYHVVIVNFEEALLGLDDGSGGDEIDDLTWVRCESVSLTNPQQESR